MAKAHLTRYLQFALVVLASGAIYPVIYLKTDYQETILEVFNLTTPQWNTLDSMLRIAFVLGYIPSGLLSDRFSAKRLLALSLFATAIGGFWFAQIPDAGSVAIIFGLWGFFSVFTFWSSHLKLIQMLARRNEQGRFFGVYEGGRGMIEALLAGVALAIFSSVLGTSTAIVNKRAALAAIIYMYSAVALVVSLLVFLFVDDDKELARQAEKSDQPQEATSRVTFAGFGNVLTNKYVYLQGGVIFMGFAVFLILPYLDGFLRANLGADAATAGSVTLLVLWMRPVGGCVGGALADKIGKTSTIGGALAGAAICLLLTAILPVASFRLLAFALIALLAGCIYAVRGAYWSLLGQSKLNAATLGTAIGVISFIGYFPDMLVPRMNRFLFAAFGDNGGYNACLIASAGFALAGVAVASVYGRMRYKEALVQR